MKDEKVLGSKFDKEIKQGSIFVGRMNDDVLKGFNKLEDEMDSARKEDPTPGTRKQKNMEVMGESLLARKKIDD